MMVAARHREMLDGVLRRAAARAGDALTGTVGSPFAAEIPEARWLSLEGCRKAFAGDDGDGAVLMGVAESFAGPLPGAVALLVAESSGLALVHAILPDGSVADGLSQSVEEVLTEVGNVWLNACIGALAEVVGGDFAGNLPVFSRGNVVEVLTGAGGAGTEEGLLLADTRVSVRGREFAGHLALMVDGRALGALPRPMSARPRSAA